MLTYLEEEGPKPQSLSRLPPPQALTEERALRLFDEVLVGLELPPQLGPLSRNWAGLPRNITYLLEQPN